jgi:hypothetical protein
VILQAVLIGSDIPDICESVLEAAFAALEEHQVSIQVFQKNEDYSQSVFKADHRVAMTSPGGLWPVN